MQQRQRLTVINGTGDPIIFAFASLDQPGGINGPKRFAANHQLADFLLAGFQQPLAGFVQLLEHRVAVFLQAGRFALEGTVVLRQLNMDLAHGLLKLLVALLVILQHADAERLQRLDDLVAENA